MERARELLRRSGMNSSESRMYLRLLKEDDFVALGALIHELGQTEFTGYRTARRLLHKGFISVVKKRNLRYVKAQPVSRIAALVGNQSRKLRRLELSLLDIQHRLGSPSSNSDDTKTMETHEGKDAFTDVYASIAEVERDELLCLGSMASLWNITEQDFYSSFEQDFIKRRLRHGTKAFIIDHEFTSFHILLENAKREHRQVRLLKENDESDEYLIMTREAAYLFDTDPHHPRAILLKTPTLIRILKNYHAMLWQSASTIEV